MLDLDACAYSWAPGNALRVSVAGADWPNTVAPPAPSSSPSTAAAGAAGARRATYPTPTFTAGAEHRTESVEGTTWEIHDDVLRRTTYARTHTVSDYATPYDGRAREDYLGEVSRRPAHLRPARARGHDLRPDLAGRRGAGAVGDGRDHHRRRGRRGDRDPGHARRRGGLAPHLAGGRSRAPAGVMAVRSLPGPGPERL